MRFDVRTVRSGPSRIDWDRNLAVFRKPETWDGETGYCFAQAKCDGIRVLAGLDQHGGPVVITTQGHRLEASCTDQVWYLRLCEHLSAGMIIDAELCAQLGGREAVKTALANRAPTQLWAFACNWLADDAPLDIAQSALNAVGQQVPEWCTTSDEWLHPLPEGEGVVYKDSMYGAWAKRKTVKTIDLIVTRIKPGVGKYWGQCGSLVCGALVSDYDIREVASVSGMDDEVRASITTADVGRVVEVKYERVGSAGRLQHPRFVRWREDKPAEDCEIDQDPELVRYIRRGEPG